MQWWVGRNRASESASASVGDGKVAVARWKKLDGLCTILILIQSDRDYLY